MQNCGSIINKQFINHIYKIIVIHWISYLPFEQPGPGVYLKAGWMQKRPPLTVILYDFAGCSQVCTYAHTLSGGQYGRLFYRFFRPLQMINKRLTFSWYMSTYSFTQTPGDLGVCHGWYGPDIYTVTFNLLLKYITKG